MSRSVSEIRVSDGRNWSSRFQPGLQLLMANNTRLLNDWPAVIEHRKVRNAANVEPRRELRMAFRINLQNHGLTRHVCSSARDLGSRHSAGSAPGCPEVNQHGNAGLAQNFVEELRIGFQGFTYWRQRRLAGSATSGVRQVSCWNTVLASAILTSSNCRHTSSPRRCIAGLVPSPSFIKCFSSRKVAPLGQIYPGEIAGLPTDTMLHGIVSTSSSA